MSTIEFQIKELSAEEASFSFSPKDLEAIKPYPFHGEIIGQPRAIKALNMGIRIPGKGYNIFVSGDPGSGRTSAVFHTLKKAPGRPEKIRDIVCLHNFIKPDQPSILYLPPGSGNDLAQFMRGFSQRLQALIAGLCADTARAIQEGNEDEGVNPSEDQSISQKGPSAELQEERSKTDSSSISMKSSPQRDSSSDTPDSSLRKLNAFPEKEKQQILKQVRELLDEGRKKFPQDRMQTYFSQLLEDLKEDIDLFTDAEAGSIRNAPFFQRYMVNILVDHQDTEKPPIIYEHNPTSSNLFGFIDTRGDSREDVPLPFLTIRSGAFMDASGGYLILNADDILKEENLWDQVKRVLNTGEITLHNFSGSTSALPTGVKPDPAAIDIKLIALGDEDLYDELSEKDPDFHKLFKISAEFDYTLKLTEKNIGKYIGFIQMVADDEQLRPVSLSGIAEILRYGCFLVEQRNYLSTQFSKIADTLREGNYWAEELGLPEIDRQAILKTLEERSYLSNLSESKIIDQILSGETLVHLDGKKVGMVNALAVLDRGEYSFGIPAVITATVAPGNEGIVNIEHEAGLSGEIHDKGLLILEGYLRKMYARNFPLSIYSGICFEQSYAEIDGDSASSSELYALLSAIGDVPIRQDIAVTGSVNQMGELQPVGGINEKIMGFYALCERRGLTGHQGVIIPDKNIENLVLPDSIIEAVRDRKFHIYPARTINEGMQILSHRQAGERNSKGLFPVHSINRLIENRLKHLYEISRQQN